MRPNKEGVIFTPVVWQVFQVLSLQELLKYGPAHPLAGVSYTSMSDHSKDFDGVNRAHQHHSLHNGPQDHFHHLRRCKVYQGRASPSKNDVLSCVLEQSLNTGDGCGQGRAYPCYAWYWSPQYPHTRPQVGSLLHMCLMVDMGIMRSLMLDRGGGVDRFRGHHHFSSP